MAIKELFNDNRPQVLFDPRASQRIDPRFKFTRNGTATYTAQSGAIKIAPSNEPRIDFDPLTNNTNGLLVEPLRTNVHHRDSNLQLIQVSRTDSADTLGLGESALLIKRTEDGASRFRSNALYGGLLGQTVTHSFYINWNTASPPATLGFSWMLDSVCRINLADLSVITSSSNFAKFSLSQFVGDWYKVSFTGVKTNEFRYFEVGIDAWVNGGVAFDYAAPGYRPEVKIWGYQQEVGASPTSYIPTTTAAVTRPADLLSIDTDIPSTGSLYIDARALTSDVNDTLLSAANASNAKLTLAIRQPASLYNSRALVYEVGGAFKPTLPFPVPGNTRERNLITYGANNYHYRTDSSRYTPSSSASVPANMTRLGIGHDVTDPTKAFTGYINAVYLWPGEITPSVAEALVRGDVDPKNADAGVFTPATGSLAFVFNTQGTATDGNRVVQLPLRGNNNNVLVDWGDNTSSSLIGAAASVNVNHTYEAAGIYAVQITSDSDGTNSGLKQLQFYLNSPLDLVRVLQWGGTTTFQPTTMYRAFYGCTQLDFENAARINLPDTSAVTDWRDAFVNCSSITGQFPAFNTSAATTFQNTWYNCNQVTSYPQFNTANVTNFTRAWWNNTSLTSFPTINTSSGTIFGGGTGGSDGAWFNCSSLVSFPLLDFSSATTLAGAWASCSSLTSFPAINTASVTRFGEENPSTGAWQGCSSLTSFPLINTSSASSLSRAWEDCSSLTSFPSITTSNCQNFFNTWNNCSSLTSFPALDFSSATGNLGGATSGDGTWRNLSLITSFPSIDTSGINGSIAGAWTGCSSLTSFPLLNFSQVTAFGADNQGAWQGCSSLTSFPAISTGNGTNFEKAWYGCSGLTSFPSIDTSKATNIAGAWRGCSNLTSFPALTTTLVTQIPGTWAYCSGLTSFPTIDTSAVLNAAADTAPLQGAWIGCTGLTTFPALNLSSCTNFGGVNGGTWYGCTGLTSFPVINFSSGVSFNRCWQNCTSLATFPAGCFSSTPGTDFRQAFQSCALSAASIQNILGDLVTAGQTTGTRTLHIGSGTNAGYSTWSGTAQGYLATLQSRGWTVTYNA